MRSEAAVRSGGVMALKLGAFGVMSPTNKTENHAKSGVRKYAGRFFFSFATFLTLNPPSAGFSLGSYCFSAISGVQSNEHTSISRC